MDLNTNSSQYSQLLNEVIVTLHTCKNQELLVVLRELFQQLEGYNVKEIHYMVIISFIILPKVYFIEKRAKEVKGLNVSTLVNHKEIFETNVRLGLRNIDELRIKYQPKYQIEHEEQQPHNVDFKEETSMWKLNKSKQKLQQKEKSIGKPTRHPMEGSAKKSGQQTVISISSSSPQPSQQPQPQLQAQSKPKSKPKPRPRHQWSSESQYQSQDQSQYQSQDQSSSSSQSQSESQSKPEGEKESSSFCEIIQPEQDKKRPGSKGGAH